MKDLKDKFNLDNLKDFSGKKKAPKIILGAIIVVLLGALGLEATNNDFDLGALMDGQSLSEAKMDRDENGNLTGVTNFTKQMCEADQYNCADFGTQEDAQKYFDQCGGEQGQDISRLDGDGDLLVCEDLPKQKTEN